MLRLIEFDEDLDLSFFYEECKKEGLKNNSSQNRIYDKFKVYDKHMTWILYNNELPVGSTVAHSFDDYENQIRPDDAPEVVKPKEVKPKFEVKEEPLPELPKPKDIFNLYKPNPKTFRGGGAFLFGDNFGIPNPFEPSEVVSNRNYMERFR